MIRVFITEDHAVVRSGLRLLIDNEPDLSVVGEANSGADALARVGPLKPDVVLMDISLPDINGLEVVRMLKQRPDSSCRILMLTMHPEADYLRLALDAGADGYVVKSVADDELLDAIRVVYRGRSYLRSEAVSVLIDDSASHMPESVLSEREVEVLKLVAHGYTNAEIGNQLYLSPKTVDTYRRRVMQKLSLDTRADLVDYALKHDLLKATQSTVHDPRH
ncbi:MAG: response regulator transcription factor [Chloroflexi bacterium]|nr:response regulator transcription factor [Chloroflexota bacterium]